MQIIEIGKLLIYEQPSKYIVNSTEYDDNYAIPVLTAGKTFILGYTDETDNVFDKLPVIIFDDFTTATKYVDFKFKVKSSAMKILHINRERVLPKYIFYRLQTINIDHSTHKRYWIQQYSKIKIAIPTIPEQEQIVKQIEESLSKLDSAVATLKKTKQQLEIYRLSILNQAFSDNRQMIPFGRITETRLGKMLDKEKNTGKLQRYLRNINVRWFEFDLSDLLEMRIEADEQEKYSITTGDLVICEGGEPGRCAVWENEETIFYQKALHRVRFTDGSNPKYYMYYLWLINKSGALSKYFTGTGIKHLTGQSLTKVLVPQTELSQQDKTVEYIENQFYTFDRIEETINQSLRQTEVLRQSVLKQAFEGD